MACVHHEGHSRAARSTLLKGLNVPKPKKISDEVLALVDAALAKHALWMEYSQLFAREIQARLEGAELDFREAIAPPLEPAPEVLPIPPQTPNPRLLLMQANKRQPFLDGTDLNFWSCTESIFAMPENDNAALERPVSPRVSLFDPPRTPRGDIERFAPLPPVSQSHPNRIIPTRGTSDRNRPATVKAEPDLINFGSVPPNTPMTASITVTNIGPRPFHFSASQTDDARLKVLTLPGVVFPGLKMTLKVRLLGTETDISTAFTLTTKESNGVISEQRIPITVHVSN
jgi:hypothetical protein